MNSGHEDQRLSRRTFIKYCAGGALVATVSCGSGFLFRDPIVVKQPSDIARFIRSTFSYLELKITDEEMDQFYVDYRQHDRRIVRFMWQRIFKGRDRQFQEERLDKMATTFLMSTDFFANGADESRPVRYVAFFDPYVSPCWNPLITR